MPGMQDQETMDFFGHGGLVLDPRRDRRRIEEENNQMMHIRQQRQQEAEFGMRMGESARARDMADRDRNAQLSMEAARNAESARLREAGQHEAHLQHLGNIVEHAREMGLTPEQTKQASDAYFSAMGIAPGLTAEQQRENAVRVSQGMPPIQAPGMPGPTGAGAPTGGGAPQGGGVPQGDGTTIPTTAYGYSQPNPNQLVQHGQVFGGPKGYDFNVNTGTFVPSGAEGTINGHPAGQALAEGAVRQSMRTGRPVVTPEAVSGQRALAGVMERPMAPGMSPDQPTLAINKMGFPVGNPVGAHPEPLTPVQHEQTTASSPGGGAGAGVSTPGSGTPTNPFGQAVSQALSGLGNIPGVRESMAPHPPPFMPSGTVAPGAAQQPAPIQPAAVNSPAQQPPPTSDQSTQNYPIRRGPVFL